MKICLIAPKVNFSTNITELNEFWFNPKNESFRKLWSGVTSALLTIAALSPPKHEIEFIDENYENIDFLKKYDLVGISSMTPNSTRSYVIADEFRKRGVKVVLGGVHPTLLPDESKKHCDAVVIGEAENVWNAVIEDLENRNLKPFYQSNKLVDLNQSPIPRFDLLKADNYKYIWLQTSRGCPHDCEYCTASKIFGKGFRRKNNGQILKELELIKSKFKNKQIFFADDNFLAQKEKIYLLIEKLANLQIRWNAQCDISVGKDKHFLSLLKKSGCVLLFIGLESITPEGLKYIDMKSWKYRQLKNYPLYINNIQSAGIGVMGSFMVGLESDENSVFDQILSFININNLYHAYFNILTPMPGTRIREILQKENRLLSDNWDNYTGYNVNFKPNKMSLQELESGFTNLYKKVYSKQMYYKNMEYFKRIQKNLIKIGK
jgi:Fe-S oxidoreductase